jgi:hypothetical protein
MSEVEVNGGRREGHKEWLKSVNPSVLGFGIVVVVVGAYAFLGWLDDTTELWPRHDESIETCFWLGGFVALFLAATIWLKSKGNSFWQRLRMIVPISLIGFIGVLLFSMRAVDIVNGWIDFPSQKTQTYQTLLLISRAYHTHGKGASANIQTMPIWSNMDVAEADYTFMLNHRRPGDLSKDADEISSKGYFCAKVMMQQSGNALRVLHAGARTLPSGTVIICPQIQVPAPPSP